MVIQGTYKKCVRVFFSKLRICLHCFVQKSLQVLKMPGAQLHCWICRHSFKKPIALILDQLRRYISVMCLHIYQWCHLQSDDNTSTPATELQYSDQHTSVQVKVSSNQALAIHLFSIPALSCTQGHGKSFANSKKQTNYELQYLLLQLLVCNNSHNRSYCFEAEYI